MSQRNNRPKVQGGFNFFDWYNQNKNNVTTLGADGFEVKAPGASSSPKPAATAQPPVGQGSRTSVGGKTYNMDDPAQVQELNQVPACTTPFAVAAKKLMETADITFEPTQTV